MCSELLTRGKIVSPSEGIRGSGSRGVPSDEYRTEDVLGGMAAKAGYGRLRFHPSVAGSKPCWAKALPQAGSRSVTVVEQWDFNVRSVQVGGRVGLVPAAPMLFWKQQTGSGSLTRQAQRNERPVTNVKNKRVLEELLQEAVNERLPECEWPKGKRVTERSSSSFASLHEQQ